MDKNQTSTIENKKEKEINPLMQGSFEKWDQKSSSDENSMHV